jgi:hypothetical protein
MMLIYQPKFIIDVVPCLVLPANRSLVGILHNNGLRHTALASVYIPNKCISLGLNKMSEVQFLLFNIYLLQYSGTVNINVVSKTAIRMIRKRAETPCKNKSPRHLKI